MKDDSLIIQNPQNPDTSFSTILFGSIYFFDTYKLPLAPITANKIEIKGWKTSLPYCECDDEGYIENIKYLNNI